MFNSSTVYNILYFKKKELLDVFLLPSDSGVSLNSFLFPIHSGALRAVNKVFIFPHEKINFRCKGHPMLLTGSDRFHFREGFAEKYVDFICKNKTVEPETIDNECITNKRYILILLFSRNVSKEVIFKLLPKIVPAKCYIDSIYFFYFRRTNLRVYRHQKKVLKKSKTNQTKNQDENMYDARERLIIDKTYFFEKLKIISNHAPQFGCNLSNLDITGETKTGLNSKLKLTCNMCKSEFFINTTDPKPTENLDINTAAVSGISNAGIGLEQFQGLCAAMNLPTLTQQMYDKKHIDICEHWTKVAHKTMAAAAERERLAAIEEGRVKNGVAVIDVIADACWSKRSYKSNYAALSGAAAIVGRKFGEVLFLGVKNKYCCICARAENKESPPKEHACFKNFTGSSSGMESEILVEGFKNSVEMYNVIYGRVIADGDSSTYSRILEERPYKDVTVEKIECRNHILRNMCNKLNGVSKDTKYSLQMRKMLTTQRILAIRKVICLAIKKLKNDVDEKGIRINKLYEDISNSYKHAFGHHNECRDYYCSSEKKSEDLLPKVKSSAVWAKIQYIVGIVATHSRSLINDYDSNAVEQFNSIIAKFVAGKRTNLVQRQTYQSRCAAAVVSYNTKSALYNLQKSLLGKSPKSKSKAFEEKRIQRNKMRKNVKKIKKT